MSLMRRRDGASRLDLKEDERNYLVTADIPAGFSMSDIKIEIRGDTLTISSKIKKVKETIEKGYVDRRKSQKSFKYSITIPKGLKADDISPNLDNGILSITLPKKSK